MAETGLRKPSWLKFKIPGGGNYTSVKKIISERRLHTVCIEARCPNIGECFGSGTATFIILGNICTRNCLYCSVSKGTPLIPDAEEPLNVAEAIYELSLKYAVITSVTRDDLPDCGAGIFAQTIRLIKEKSRACTVEVLVPDFKQSMRASIDAVIAAGPDIINHNIEVVKSHYRYLRPMGDYDTSLKLLNYVARNGLEAKSGLMIGFGETLTDIINTLRDLKSAGCTSLTIGQYLQSLKTNSPVKKYYHPDEFKDIEQAARDMGFKKVLSGPLVRSSYHAHELSEIK